MRPTHRLGQLLVLLTLCGTYTASAEDIDLFLRNEAVAGVRPNVLLVLDNAASNNSTITMLDGVTKGAKLDMMRDVLVNILDPDNSSYFRNCLVVGATRTPVGCVTVEEVRALRDSINLGLMINNPSGTDAGGYVRYHVRPMNVETNRLNLLAKIRPSIPQSNNAPYAKSMHEAYQYFAGRHDYVGFESSVYDPGAELGDDVYRSPITESCQDNYILFVGNGGPDSGEVRETGTLLSRLGGVLRTDPIQFSPSNYTSSWFDEYARTMKRQDVRTDMDGIQNVTTYTIAVQSPEDRNYSTTDMQSARKLLQSAAAVGGGEYYEAQNGQQALRAFIDMLRKFQAVDSVFAASTLPVSVNVRGTFLNQVYMGQFRPEENAAPRWPGNLKQYRIALNASGQPVLADRFGEAVEDTNKGFILPDKTSFWTVDSTYWSFFPIGNPPSGSDAPDGNVVEKGGAAQRLRQQYATSQIARKLYTCGGSCVVGEALSTHPFNDGNAGITAAALTATSPQERTAIINWVRGADNVDDENADGVDIDIRARIHGDLLHSRPAVVNYNRDGSDRDIVVYYGTNHGIFHAVKGGQDDTDGGEKWGMVFPEFFGKLKRLRDNDPVISPSFPKPYFADGPVSAFQHDANDDGRYVAADGDRAYLYVGMRRGGRFAYALDVSDPDNPKHLWKISNSGDFAELGQTWSTLRPARIRAVANDPVVIFGAGYDPGAEDPDPVNPGTNTMGRGIFVVNGRTGARVAHIMPAGMAAVAADVAVLDRDEDGYYDRIYAADTRGNVWRIDIDDALPGNWRATKLAAFGGTGVDARKFLNKPDVVFGADYDAILLGSGDREHPFDRTVENRFYMLKDTNIGLSGGYICSSLVNGLTVPGPCLEGDLEDVTLNPYQDSTTITLQKKGWYLTLDSGEKVVGNAMTVFGTTYFGTNLPVESDGVCDSNLGEARMYAVGYEGGTATTDTNADGVIDIADRVEVIPGGGFPPSPVYARVDVDGKTVDAVCTGSHCTSPNNVTTTTKRFRTYWHIAQ